MAQPSSNTYLMLTSESLDIDNGDDGELTERTYLSSSIHFPPSPPPSPTYNVVIDIEPSFSSSTSAPHKAVS